MDVGREFIDCSRKAALSLVLAYLVDLHEQEFKVSSGEAKGPTGYFCAFPLTSSARLLI